MSPKRNARDAVLQSIRESLAASEPLDAAYNDLHSREGRESPRTGISLPLAPGEQSVAGAAVAGVASSPTARFAECLEAIGGHPAIVSCTAAARALLFEILHKEGARRVALSDSSFVRAVISGDGATAPCELLSEPSRAEMFTADAGVSSAQWAIAESGTLVLETSLERNRLVSLIPPIHIAIVPEKRLCATMEAALTKLRAEGGGVNSRAITFITGPSQTADIEQKLVKGVHGPKSLFVIIVQDDTAPEPARHVVDRGV